MKKNTKVIIYDDDCPLCSAYTGVFVNSGFLEKEGRKNFNEIDTGLFSYVDKSRCNNEIPVIDAKTKQVWYGIDALLEILDQKIPFIKSVGQLAPVKWLLKKLYKLISYNRKVIVAVTPAGSYDSSPDFNVTYRVLLLVIGFTFNTYMLFPYAQTIFSNSFVDESTIAQLQKSHLLFVLINIGCALSLKMKTGLEYLGQVNMLALICILILVPLHFLNNMLPINSILNNIYLAALALYLLYSYSKRMKYAGIIKNHPVIVCINILSVALFIFYLSA